MAWPLHGARSQLTREAKTQPKGQTWNPAGNLVYLTRYSAEPGNESHFITELFLKKKKNCMCAQHFVYTVFFHVFLSFC